jgi:hypothetical protein
VPFGHEVQWPRPPSAILFKLPEEGLDIGFVLIIIGVDCGVSDDVCRRSDLATLGYSMAETKAYGIKIWRNPREVEKRVKLVSLRVIERYQRSLALDTPNQG